MSVCKKKKECGERKETENKKIKEGCVNTAKRGQKSWIENKMTKLYKNDEKKISYKQKEKKSKGDNSKVSRKTKHDEHSNNGRENMAVNISWILLERENLTIKKN